MECDVKRPIDIDCAALMNLLNMPCLPVQTFVYTQDDLRPAVATMECFERLAFAIMKTKSEIGSYIQAWVSIQYNIKTKKEYNYWYTPKGFTMIKKLDKHGIPRYYDAPQKCMYLSSNPLTFTTPKRPYRLSLLFPEMYKFPIHPDGTPIVPHADLWPMMSTGARAAAYTPGELAAINAHLDTKKFYDKKYTLCIERYENIGRSIYDKFNQKPGILKDIKWSKMLKDPFAYFVAHLTGTTAALGRKEFEYTD